ncbi:MAG: hypothetical protein FJ304_11120 [Planctomycetes bacterium]|nr:hypothetical protein [Planctomycetota bacterium]
MLNTKEIAFETAIVDGINIFVRTVLAAKGVIRAEEFERITDKEILGLKYQIARELARKWAEMPLRD